MNHVAVIGAGSWGSALAYLLVQLIGAVLGVFGAHAMFDEPILQASEKLRDGPGQAFAEVVATFGLIAAILGVPVLVLVWLATRNLTTKPTERPKVDADD